MFTPAPFFQYICFLSFNGKQYINTKIEIFSSICYQQPALQPTGKAVFLNNTYYTGFSVFPK